MRFQLNERKNVKRIEKNADNVVKFGCKQQRNIGIIQIVLGHPYNRRFPVIFITDFPLQAAHTHKQRKSLTSPLVGFNSLWISILRSR